MGHVLTTSMLASMFSRKDVCSHLMPKSGKQRKTAHYAKKSLHAQKNANHAKKHHEMAMSVKTNGVTRVKRSSTLASASEESV